MLHVGIMMLESVMYRNEHLLVLAMHGICIIILASTVLNLSRYDRNTSTTLASRVSRLTKISSHNLSNKALNKICGPAL